VPTFAFFAYFLSIAYTPHPQQNQIIKSYQEDRKALLVRLAIWYSIYLSYGGMSVRFLIWPVTENAQRITKKQFFTFKRLSGHRPDSPPFGRIPDFPASLSVLCSWLLRRMNRNIADLSACMLAEIRPSGGGPAGIFNYRNRGSLH
jgi:hypothetical protein